MQIIRKKLNLTKLEYHKTHLSFINCLLPVKMTPKEIEVLAGFMALEGDIAKHRFGKTARKLIMEELKLSPSGLSNYIKSLSDNNFLKEDQAKELQIWPLLIPEEKEQEYQFKIIKVPDEIKAKITEDSSNISSDINSNITSGIDDSIPDNNGGTNSEENKSDNLAEKSNLELIDN